MMITLTICFISTVTIGALISSTVKAEHIRIYVEFIFQAEVTGVTKSLVTNMQRANQI